MKSPTKPHSRLCARLSSNPKTYREERNQEINQTISQLKRQGITFHHNREEDSSSESRTDRQALLTEKKPPLNWRFLFSFCCLTIMLYYAFILLF